MRISRFGIATIVMFLIGIAIFAQSLIQHEEKKRERDLRHKGNYLVSLMALHPMEDFNTGKRDFIVKTLAEYVTSEGLVYCIVHDQTGTPLLSLAHREVVDKIPTEVKQRSLYVNGLVHQTFKISGTDNLINEFAKPIYQDGEKSGTVRMGFDLPPITIFSPARVKLMAMMAFFTFAMGVLVYYGVTLALRPLQEVNQNFRSIYLDSSPPSSIEVKNGGVAEIIRDLEQSVVKLRDKYQKIQTENIDLTTKCGIISFEKNNVFSILDSINYGIIVTDIQDNISHINSYMLNLLEKSRSDVVDHPLIEILGHDQITAFILQQEELKHSKNSSYIEATFPELASGEYFQVSLGYLTGKQEGVIGKVISFKNITSEKTSEKAKHEFITHITHELLTPLTTINSYNEMLMDDEIDNVEMQKEFYNTISDETRRLTRLVKNLLNISKIEMGSLTLKKGLVKSDWLFDDCLTAVEGAAQKKNITIERNLPDHFPSLFGDKELLKVGIINILGNAVKYTPEKGQIKFTLTEQDDVIVFEVIDNGYGISKEDLAHIFDKFYRSTDPRVNEQTGSGLGLALTSEIIRLHGGEVQVSSKVDEGSHFIIRLPKEEYYLGKQ
ncbi:MAG: cell wall metabolism sensor histidine kinase WalK [Deltaproteobacteria bacterium]|nr:cell wall metabolism sensor histidine kinase WalK [Deltaproteobacteria bacterium]